ncbi:MAG: type II toxin-antitoxin system MqsA family antitoxin [Magnetococcus sp. YQC-3]
MKCTFCRHGVTLSARTTVTLEREKMVLVIRDVPADLCEQCGEYYLDEETTSHVLMLAEEATHHQDEVKILSYAA